METGVELVALPSGSAPCAIYPGEDIRDMYPVVDLVLEPGLRYYERTGSSARDGPTPSTIPRAESVVMRGSCYFVVVLRAPLT
ncbi:hypothetical protein UK82_29105 [Frankia sp. ACN1ag]|nr:hypothetical protein UK82_29105 [Frankia sp. ACN1ag]